MKQALNRRRGTVNFQERRSAESPGRLWGVRPDAIATSAEADLELKREQIRDSRWKRRCSQAVFALTYGVGSLLFGLHLAGLV